MAVTHLYYGKAFLSTFNKEADWDTDTIKCSLHTVTYVPAQDTDQYHSAATNEITGTGYTAGGATLATPTQSYTGATNVWALDAGDAAWTTATFTCRIGAVYDSTPATEATRPLLSYVDMGADQTVSAANFTIQWDAAGIVKVTVS